MPLDYGCGLDQHHGVEELWPNPIKPHPEEPVCGEEPKPALTLAPQDGHLMSQRDQFEFQGGAAADTEREDGNDGGKNHHHGRNGTATGQNSLAFLSLSEF